MGNKPSFMLQDEEINLISEETGFSPAQIEKLYSRFTALDKSGNGSLSRQDCLAIPELAINPLCDRIVQMFFSDCDDDHERINFRQFMKVLATFRSSHKSWSPNSRTRNISRQDSINSHQRDSILKQAPLLFDSIDPSAFTTNAPITRHSRHSSYQDGFLDAHSNNHNHHHHHNQHHHNTTNQHNFHYAASSTHLPSVNGHVHHHFHNNNHGSGTSLSEGNNGKHVQFPLVDPEEPANSRKQKLFFMFKVYDVNNDDLIDLDDLIAILKMMVGTYVDEARVRRIAERSLREADKNGDGYVDFDEFCSALSRKDIDESLRVKFSCST